VQSSARKAAVEEVGHLLEAGDSHEIKTGIDFWFTPECIAPPRRWKQFLLTVSAVYPLSLVIPQLLSPLYRAAPVLDTIYLRSLFTAVCLTAALTFLVMPHYTRLVKRWLFDEEPKAPGS
jgi:antibiotic biosynthesis monooxygenase (ABM) superfamily enzyme